MCHLAAGDGPIQRNVYIYNNIFTYAPGSSIKTSGGQGIFIHNNTFFGFNHTYDNYQAHIFGGDRTAGTVVQNNICYNDAPDSRYACLEIGNGRHGEYTVDHNLYFTSDNAHARLLWEDGGTSYFFDDDWSSYTAGTGFDANSPEPADPEFVDAPEDFTPAATSPAVGQGVAVEWVTTDYLGNDRGESMDIGAIQH